MGSHWHLFYGNVASICAVLILLLEGKEVFAEAAAEAAALVSLVALLMS